MVSSFLTDRSAILNVGQAQYQTKTPRGCPQGSLLSPFLWNLIADSAFSLSLFPGVKLRGYADDLWMYKTGGNLQNLKSSLEASYQCFSQWASDSCLEVSEAKTQLMLFTRQRQPVNFSVTLNDRSVTSSTTVKHLGFLLDRKLKWSPHLKDKCIKAKRTIFFIKRIAKLTWGPNRFILKKLFLH